MVSLSLRVLWTGEHEHKTIDFDLMNQPFCGRAMLIIELKCSKLSEHTLERSLRKLLIRCVISRLKVYERENSVSSLVGKEHERTSIFISSTNYVCMINESSLFHYPPHVGHSIAYRIAPTWIYVFVVYNFNWILAEYLLQKIARRHISVSTRVVRPQRSRSLHYTRFIVKYLSLCFEWELYENNTRLPGCQPCVAMHMGLAYILLQTSHVENSYEIKYCSLQLSWYVYVMPNTDWWWQIPLNC